MVGVTLEGGLGYPPHQIPNGSESLTSLVFSANWGLRAHEERHSELPPCAQVKVDAFMMICAELGFDSTLD